MRKALLVARRVLVILLLVFAVVMTALTFLSVAGLNKERGILGYQFYIVLSDSMKEQFASGDMVISKTTDPAALVEGDIITFTSADPDIYGDVVTHKIQRVLSSGSSLSFETYGTTTGVRDAYPVPASNVLGKYITHVPKAGFMFDFLKSTAGYVVLILVPFALLILFEGSHIISLLKRYKGEQQQLIDEQQKELEEEKKKTEEMAEELNRMKEALQVKQSAEPEPEAILEEPDKD